MWDVGGDEFDSLEDTNVGRLEIAELSLDEPQLEAVLFGDDDDIEVGVIEEDVSQTLSLWCQVRRRIEGTVFQVCGEVCLEAACNCLENEVRTLQLEAHPALDKLTSKINTLNLELVHQLWQSEEQRKRMQKEREKHMLFSESENEDEDHEVVARLATARASQPKKATKVAKKNDADGPSSATVVASSRKTTPAAVGVQAKSQAKPQPLKLKQMVLASKKSKDLLMGTC
ncbi:magnesium transporter MRS2-I-like [Argentina anserina]|uniref:magnesium transporter MRS2-I-like n=1 Tax=Argentina anserina TaxID=57926 RepID=UPI0021764A7E|nr:magnesium transporter MRS2-I-like [Potentilla anserina]